MNRLLQQTYVRNESERSETEITFMIGNYQHQYSLTDIKDFYGCKIDGVAYVFQSFPPAKARPLWSLLLTGNCNGYIPGNYLKIVENLKEINNYSWGKTYIKSVHEALSTKKDNTKISCTLGPIIASLFFHFPGLKNDFFKEILRIRPVEFSMKVPLCETWFDVTHYYGSGPNFLKLTHDYKLETTISEEARTETAITKDVGTGVLDVNQKLPFLKNSPVWKTVDSLEVLRKMPQKPHFCNVLGRGG
ncbi:hypothetical protein ACFE04_015015 [Oxalis oulophora]